ncbi:hypothetical protein KSS87_010462, partial [Heliosperma pusillum]
MIHTRDRSLFGRLMNMNNAHFFPFRISQSPCQDRAVFFDFLAGCNIHLFLNYHTFSLKITHVFYLSKTCHLKAEMMT